MSGITYFFIGGCIGWFIVYVWICCKYRLLEIEKKSQEDLHSQTIGMLSYWYKRCKQAEKMRDDALFGDGEEWKKDK